MNHEQINSLHRLEAGGQVRLTISQETFDEAVQENIVDFEMDFEEAVTEAVEQFTMQGVSLRNIRKDNPVDRVNVTQGVVQACNTLRECVETTEAAELNAEGQRVVTDEVQAKTLAALDDLITESEISDERRSAANDNAAIGILSAVNTWMVRDLDICCRSLEAMASLFKLDLCKEAAAGCCNPAAGALVALIAHHINEPKVVEKGFMAIRQACNKFEYGKNTFDEVGIVDVLVKALQAHPEDASVCKSACSVMRQLVLRDDHREQTDQCFDRARELNEKRALQEACQVLKTFHQDITIVPIVMSALACTALNAENVNALVSCGVRDITLDTFRANQDNASIVKDSCFILGSLSQLDDQKKIIGQGDGMALIISSMDTHRADTKVIAKALKAMSCISLRMPINCTRIAESGGIPLICDLMRAHATAPNLQASCLTLIRNLVSRNQELVPMVIDEGAEELVRRASALPSCNQLAFAALRDLHCEVTFKEEWKGDIGYEKRLAQGDGEVEDEDFKELMHETKTQMAEATGLARFAT